MSEHTIILLIQLALCAATIIVGFLLWHLTSKAYYRSVNKYAKNPKSGNSKNSLWHIFYSISRTIIVLVTVYLSLYFLNIDISKSIAGLGIASAAAGFALQDTIKDFVKGVSILADKFYEVGDVIEYDGRMTEVVAITIRSTKVRDIEDGTIITVFNGNIDKITKLSGVQFLEIPLSYKDDFHKINALLEDVAAEIERLDNVILCSYKGITNYEDSHINYRIKVTSKQLDRADVRRAAWHIIQRRLCEAGITVPFNQIDVHMQ